MLQCAYYQLASVIAQVYTISYWPFISKTAQVFYTLFQNHRVYLAQMQEVSNSRAINLLPVNKLGIIS